MIVYYQYYFDRLGRFFLWFFVDVSSALMIHCCKFETRLISILELDQVLCKIKIISQSLLEYFFHPKTWKYSKTTSIVMTWDPLFDLQKNSFIPSLKKYEQQELQKLVHDDLSLEIQLHIYKQKKYKKKWMVFKAVLHCFSCSALFYVGKIERRKICRKSLPSLIAKISPPSKVRIHYIVRVVVIVWLFRTSH